MARLTAKRRAFIESYLQCWNATEAARRAGYSYPNKQGPKISHDPDVRHAIESRLAAETMKASEVLARLTEQARANIGEFLTEKGQIDVEKIRERGHLVKSVSQSGSRSERDDGRESWSQRLELYDAQAALQLIGRHYGLFRDVVDQRVAATIGLGAITPAELDRARQELADWHGAMDPDYYARNNRTGGNGEDGEA